MKTLQQTYRLDCLPTDNPYLSDNWRPLTPSGPPARRTWR
jgi:hypothetical protein